MVTPNGRTEMERSIARLNHSGNWDPYNIPVSNISDKIFKYSLGKSILGIWQKISIDVK